MDYHHQLDTTHVRRKLQTQVNFGLSTTLTIKYYSSSWQEFELKHSIMSGEPMQRCEHYSRNIKDYTIKTALKQPKVLLQQKE